MVLFDLTFTLFVRVFCSLNLTTMATKPQFDTRLGGEMEVPIEVDTMKFATARAQEIAALSQALGNLQFTFI